MAEYAAVPSGLKLDMLRLCIIKRGLIPQDSFFKVFQRYIYHTCLGFHEVIICDFSVAMKNMSNIILMDCEF